MEDVEDIHTPFKKPLEFFYIHQFVPWRLKKKTKQKKNKKKTIIYKKTKVNNNINNNKKTDISIL